MIRSDFTEGKTMLLHKLVYGTLIVFVFFMIYFFIGPFPNYNYVQDEPGACLQVKNNITETVIFFTGYGEQTEAIAVYPYIMRMMGLKD